ncbi:MAG: hypothetical protein KF819_25420 [Labilithrix sp.]|nr:hypothetical protein [Labilithrix sp.]
MHALDLHDELLPSDRPTIPVPRESGVRLKVSRVAFSAATVDVVVCDLSRDPRSEYYVPKSERFVQNESPPSTSIVRALR